MRTTAKELRVSIITIKKTWEMMESQGLIYTIQGKGSYVRGHSKADLDEKKKKTIKQALRATLETLESYDIDRETLLQIFIDLLNEKQSPF